MNSSSLPDFNELHSLRTWSLAEGFLEGVGRRAFFLIDAFPFMIIGEIVAVESDFVLVCIETTHVAELEGRVIRLHIDEIEAFFIEDGAHTIPRIRELP
ncbi:MAG: hypothetical protein ACOY94_27550 [Bacillota bacterium]